jgi:hypothetical protein
MPYVDFDDLKQRFNIEQVAQLLGLTLTQRSDQLRGECPACKSGRNSLSITPGYHNKDGSVGAFYCFAKRESGDLVQLIAHVRDTDVHSAAKWLDGNSRNSTRSPDRGTVHRTDGERGFKPLDYLEPEHEAITMGIGMSPEIAKQIGCGYAPKGIHRGLVAVACFDFDAAIAAGVPIVGYIGITEANLPANFKPDSKVVPLKRA